MNAEENLIIKVIDGKSYFKAMYCFFPIWISSENEVNGFWSLLAINIDTLTSLGQTNKGFLFVPYFKGDNFFNKFYQYFKIRFFK